MELICYLSNGYPTMKESGDTAAAYAEAGCGIIEVALPSRNPYMDNDLIAGHMRKALEQCGDYERYMDHMVLLKKRLPQVHFLLLVYEDTICEIGVKQFSEFCREHGFLDIIRTGVRGKEIQEQLMEQGLLVSCYITSLLPPDEVRQALQSNGFVYLQAKPFHTLPDGEHGEMVQKSLKERIACLRSLGIVRPIYCGVGIATPEDVREVEIAGADAVFVGSAILKLLENKEEMVRLIQQMKQASTCNTGR